MTSRKTTGKRAATTKARYGKTMKGTGGKAKPSVSVKPKRRGATVKVSF